MSSMTQILKLDLYKMHVPVPMAVLQVKSVDDLAQGLWVETQMVQSLKAL